MNGLAATHTAQARVVTDIAKSQNDDRSYRGLVLDNGMKVLLVSDPTTDMSAAALDVHIGYMVDDQDLPGLAHFLFLGTEKYPDETEYSKFLSQHGGGSNAYTAGDHTNYYFDVTPKNLEGALDRFSQFFIAPLFTESATDREVNAVNSEHEKNLPSDTWRLMQLESSLSDPEHDYHKFGTGSKATLDEIPRSKGINVRDRLLQFHDRWYSSNIMTLAVLGSESLDDLESMARRLFGGVKNKDVEIQSWPRHPFGEHQSKMQHYVVPVKDIRQLNLLFPTDDLHPYYKTSPGHYLGHLIGHEGKGSLLSELKSLGWVNTLVGGQKTGSKGFAFFIVNVDLTVEGEGHVDDIITLVYQYLRMLREVGPLEWIFDECKNLNAMQFRFKDKTRPQSYACSLSSRLHDYPMEEALSGGYLQTEWKPELITQVLDNLVPERMTVTVVSQKYKDVADQSEAWYGTKYKSEAICKEKIEKWSKVDLHERLQLPDKNEFIPTRFELVKREDVNEKSPFIIKETPMSTLWFKQDDEFLLPKASINIRFRCPLAYHDPHHFNLTYMFIELLKDDLTEYTYDAELSGLYYGMATSKVGFTLTIRGYNERQYVLLDKIIARMIDFKVNEERFKVLKESYQRGLKNFSAEQPHQHAIYYNTALLAERQWLKADYLEEMDGLTAEAVQGFYPRLLSKLHVEVFVHGNQTEESALEMLSMMETHLAKLDCKPLTKAQMVREREVELAVGSHSIFTSTTDVHKSSCIEIYYQCGLQGTRQNALIELFSQIINEPCFNVLRTKEQLGYIVFSGVRRASGVQGLRVIVQSDRHPDYLDSRIEAFLHSMDDHLEKMSADEFERNKTALADKRLEKPKQLSARTAKLWSEIVTQLFNFDRDQIEVDELRKVTKEDLLAFHRKFFSHQSKERRKLSSHVISMTEDGAGKVPPGTENGDKVPEDLLPAPKIDLVPDVIEDIVSFKTNLALNPTLKPFQDPSAFKKCK